MRGGESMEKERILSDLYTKIRIVNENGVTVAVITDYECDAVADGYTVVLTPKYGVSP